MPTRTSRARERACVPGAAFRHSCIIRMTLALPGGDMRAKTEMWSITFHTSPSVLCAADATGTRQHTAQACKREKNLPEGLRCRSAPR
eukprot:1240588-Pleurochrysis_carterae.AAC.1